MKLRIALAAAVPLLAFAVSCAGGDERGSGAAISRGKIAPSFVLPSATGERISLSDFVGHRPVLLYFSMGPG